MARSDYLFTSESVSEGHPDKVSDRISDEVVDLFFREGPKEGMSPWDIRAACETLCTTNGVVIALYAATNYEPQLGPPATGFRGFTLCVNLESFEECVAVYKTLRDIDGVEVLEEPTRAFWGGGFSWRDPEGNIWDVAWAEGTTFDERGGVYFP